MSQNLEDMFQESILESRSQDVDYGMNEMMRIENEYMDLKLGDKKAEERLSAEKELKSRLAVLKKQLRACKNVKNAKKTNHNASLAKKRLVIKKKITEISALIEMLNKEGPKTE